MHLRTMAEIHDFVQDRHFPRSVPPNNVNKVFSCSELYWQSLDAACQEVGWYRRVNVWYCPNGSHLLLLSPTPSVFSVRVVGLEVFNANLYYCSEREAYATLDATTTGHYHIEILQLFSNFSYWDFQWEHYYSSTKMKLASFYLNISTVVSRMAYLSGRWSTSRSTSFLHTTCTDWRHRKCSHALSLSIKDSELSYTNFQAKCQGTQVDCRSSSFYCFFGDSQMRHAYNGFVNAILSPDITPPTRWDLHNGTDYGIMTSSCTRYKSEPWGRVSKLSNISWLMKCTHILVNVGQWPAFPKVGKGPWTARQYANTLSQLATWMRHRMERNISVYYLTTNSVAYRIIHTAKGDYRSDPLMILYNNIAVNAMRLNNITVLDTWSITSPLSEMSYDSAHFHFSGIVGNAITNLIKGVIC